MACLNHYVESEDQTFNFVLVCSCNNIHVFGYWSHDMPFIFELQIDTYTLEPPPRLMSGKLL